MTWKHFHHMNRWMHSGVYQMLLTLQSFNRICQSMHLRLAWLASENHDQSIVVDDRAQTQWPNPPIPYLIHAWLCLSELSCWLLSTCIDVAILVGLLLGNCCSNCWWCSVNLQQQPQVFVLQLVPRIWLNFVRRSPVRASRGAVWTIRSCAVCSLWLRSSHQRACAWQSWHGTPRCHQPASITISHGGTNTPVLSVPRQFHWSPDEGLFLATVLPLSPVGIQPGHPTALCSRLLSQLQIV